MTGLAEGVDEPSEILLSTLPPDDSGAQTADRYEWQAAMAAADLLGEYVKWLEAGRTSDADLLLVCEWHEDWAIVRGATVEVVSAKHREPQIGAFTGLRELMDQGGVFHLMQSWLALGRVPACRLVTTAALDSKLNEFKEACAYFHQNGATVEGIAARETLLNRIVRTARHLDDSMSIDPDVVAAFLGCLRIVEGRPHRDWVPHLAPSGFARPAARLLGRPDAEQAVWGAALAIVRERMRAGGPTRRGLLPPVLGEAQSPEMSARCVSLAEIHDAVTVGLDFAAGYSPPPRLFDPSELGIKLAAGSLSDNVITHAQMLRRRYVRFRHAAADIPGERERFERIERALMSLVRDAELIAPGGALWYEVERQVRVVAETDAFGGLDADYLIGAVADLTQQCKVWFSHSFDIKARRREILASGTHT